MPVLLLSMTTKRAVILRAANLGVSGYIWRSAFSLKELLAQDSKTDHAEQGNCGIAGTGPSAKKPAVAQGEPDRPRWPPPRKDRAPPPDLSASPRILRRQQVLERLEHVAGEKTLAGVVAQLVAVANSPLADMSDVVRVIQSDPILASRVLQLVNSASTGSRGRVRSVGGGNAESGCPRHPEYGHQRRDLRAPFPPTNGMDSTPCAAGGARMPWPI